MTATLPSQPDSDPGARPGIDYRSDREESWNFVTHAIGFAASLAATYFLIPSLSGKNWLVQSAVITYAAIMVSLYAASALSHYYHRGKLRSFFRKADQALIFLFIVAGYTPFFAADLTETWAWIGVAGMWIAAVTGFCSKLFFGHRIEGIATWTYLALGWGPAIGLPFAKSIPLQSIMFIAAGGLIYTFGVVVLLNDHRRWYLHSIWHMLVIAGTVTHYWGIQLALH